MVQSRRLLTNGRDTLANASKERRAEILNRLPQRPPFLFLDEILLLTEESIIARKCFRHDEYFYPGHFPGSPVTPGVILLETMAQAALVALGIYLSDLEGEQGAFRTLFTECAVEFLDLVLPGEIVEVIGCRTLWRRRKLRSEVELVKDNGVIVARGVIAGMGVMIAEQNVS